MIDGASWRPRTPAVTHKVYAALPDERRRILHREVLNHLLDTVSPGSAPRSPSPGGAAGDGGDNARSGPNTHLGRLSDGYGWDDAIDVIARHACASGDTRAPGWIREAIRKAHASNQWHKVVELSRETWPKNTDDSRELELVLCEALLRLGRLSEAITQLLEIECRSDTPPSISARTRRMLALAYYEARDWERVLTLAIPDDAESAEDLCELRLLRACSLRHLNRKQMADREVRLARAEVEVSHSPKLAIAEHEQEYVNAFYSSDWPRVRAALTKKLRLLRNSGDRGSMVGDLAKYGNALRYMCGDINAARPVFIRAIALSREVGSSAIAKCALHTSIGYSSWTTTNARQARRHLGRADSFALQSGIASFIGAARIRLITKGLYVGRGTYADKCYIMRVMTTSDQTSSSVLHSAGIDLAHCLLYYALHDDLERLEMQLKRELHDDVRVRMVGGIVTIGRLWLDDDHEEALQTERNQNRVGRTLAKRLLNANVGNLWLSAIAYAGTRGPWDDSAWPPAFRAKWVISLACTDHVTGWGSACLALALALWIPIQFSLTNWNSLLCVIRRCARPFPVALEWQRLLVESREARRIGDWRTAQSLRRTAGDQLRLLTRPECGSRGPEAFARWMRRYDQDGASIKTEEKSAPPSLRQSAVVLYPPTLSRIPHWATAVEAARKSDRLVIISRHLRELEEFAAVEAQQAKNSTAKLIRMGDPSSQLNHMAHSAVVLVAPNLWEVEQLRRAASMLRSAPASQRRVTLSTVSLETFRTSGPEHRAFCELIDGMLIELPPASGSSDAREVLFAEALTSAGGGRLLDERVIAAVRAYTWPGGLGEIEQVARTCVAFSNGTATWESLEQTGWFARTDTSAADSSQERDILNALLTQSREQSLSEIMRSVGSPRRTLLRYVNMLVEGGRVVRRGRGPATRYRLAGPATYSTSPA